MEGVPVGREGVWGPGAAEAAGGAPVQVAAMGEPVGAPVSHLYDEDELRVMLLPGVLVATGFTDDRANAVARQLLRTTCFIFFIQMTWALIYLSLYFVQRRHNYNEIIAISINIMFYTYALWLGVNGVKMRNTECGCQMTWLGGYQVVTSISVFFHFIDLLVLLANFNKEGVNKNGWWAVSISHIFLVTFSFIALYLSGRLAYIALPALPSSRRDGDQPRARSAGHRTSPV